MTVLSASLAISTGMLSRTIEETRTQFLNAFSAIFYRHSSSSSALYDKSPLCHTKFPYADVCCIIILILLQFHILETNILTQSIDS
jgi:hypothetical protein